jgi:formylglycine-generating enzyme required for sulfatase activity
MRLEPIKGVPKRMNNALRKALSKNSKDRCKNCMEFAAKLEREVPWTWIVCSVVALACILVLSLAWGRDAWAKYKWKTYEPLWDESDIMRAVWGPELDENKISKANILYIKSHQQDDDRIVELNGVKMLLKYVRGGEFIMGSPTTEKRRYKEERQHHVTLIKDYWIGETEVTQDQYKAVMGWNPSYFLKGGNYPVECIAWENAMAFCQKLTQVECENGHLPEGYEYTLPTEAQWEYAARGGHKFSRYCVYSGSDKIIDVAWYNYNSFGITHPVGQKCANALGLYDMNGNVSEWVRDWYDSYPNNDMQDPVGPASGVFRVRRGGSWHSLPEFCRVAVRNGYPPSFRNPLIGFRVALAPVK